MKLTPHQKNIIKYRNMSNKEFDEYCKKEYKRYSKGVKHSDDDMNYGDFWIEMCGIWGRPKGW